jgi:hypothetical protein
VPALLTSLFVLAALAHAVVGLLESGCRREKQFDEIVDAHTMVGHGVAGA